MNEEIVEKPYGPFVIRPSLLEQHLQGYKTEVNLIFGYDIIELNKLDERGKLLLASYVYANSIKYLDKEDYTEVFDDAGPFTWSVDHKIPRHCDKYLECFIPVFIRGMKKNKHQKFFEFFSGTSL